MSHTDTNACLPDDSDVPDDFFKRCRVIRITPKSIEDTPAPPYINADIIMHATFVRKNGSGPAAIAAVVGVGRPTRVNSSYVGQIDDLELGHLTLATAFRQVYDAPGSLAIYTPATPITRMLKDGSSAEWRSADWRETYGVSSDTADLVLDLYDHIDHRRPSPVTILHEVTPAMQECRRHAHFAWKTRGVSLRRRFRLMDVDRTHHQHGDPLVNPFGFLKA